MNDHRFDAVLGLLQEFATSWAIVGTPLDRGNEIGKADAIRRRFRTALGELISAERAAFCGELGAAVAMQHKAACYDELMAALQDLLSQIARFRVMQGEPYFETRRASAVIARATGVTTGVDP